MKINVNTIPEEGMRLDIEKNSEWFSHLVADSDAYGFNLERLDFACVVRKIGDNVYIEGSIDVKGDIPCARCLEITELSVQSPFNCTFSPTPPEWGDETELSAADLDFEYYEGEMIDLDEVVFEQVMLQIPMKPLCVEACRGLCPHCGANLNRTTCNCQTEDVDERLAVLKKLKVEH